MPRINRCVELLDQGQPVYYDRVNVPDLGYDYGRDLSGTWADYLRIEFEHISMDTSALYEFMRGLKDAGPTRSGHPSPAVMCTIPATGMSEPMAGPSNWRMAGYYGLRIAITSGRNCSAPSTARTTPARPGRPFRLSDARTSLLMNRQSPN